MFVIGRARLLPSRACYCESIDVRPPKYNIAVVELQYKNSPAQGRAVDWIVDVT
jgi:hypothetical protein